MPDQAAPADYPFKTVQALLMRLARVRADDRTAFLGRFQYFQRMDFPIGRVGRGRKVAYGLDEIWQLAIAFEFLQVGTSPVRAVRLVRSSWMVAREAVARAWKADRIQDRPFLVLFPRALDDLRPEAGAERLPSRDTIGYVPASDLAKLALGEIDAGDDALLVQIDARRLGARVVREMEALGIEDAKARMDAFATAVTDA